MKALGNAVHLAVLALWAVLGVLFTLKSLFVLGALVPVLAFWLWFGGFAALTSLVTRSFEGPVAALLTHAGAFVGLSMVPRVFPFALLRVGLDLLLGYGLPHW